MVEVRNAAAEARAMVGDGRGARVLEPSPPAIDDGDFFADDPLWVETDGSPIVSVVGGDLTWGELIAERPDVASWAAERWLAGPRRLPPIPDDLAEGRLALHRLATYVVAPARHQANGKFGLRWTKGGFGTPFFGADEQVRVEGEELIVQRGDSVLNAPITTLRAAAELIGSKIDAETASEHDSPPIGDIDEPLAVSAEVTAFLGSWWGLGTAALEHIRFDETSIDPSRVQLWPGHFDPAIEVGDEDHRASYGASPGDQNSPEPYLYLAAWWPDRLNLAQDPFWNADGFVGAHLPYRELAAADDPVAAALAFYRKGRDLIATG